MDNTRIILVAALCFVLLLLWQAWQRDYGPRPPRGDPDSAERAAPSAAGDLPQVTRDPRDADTGAVPAPQSEAAPPRAGGANIRVVTDALDARIGLNGGVLERIALREYPVSVDRPEEPLILLDDAPERFFVMQDGLLGEDAGPNHHARYETAREVYRLGDGRDVLEVPLTWSRGDGLTVRKVYRFERGRHLVRVRYEIDNATGDPWRGRLYGQFQRRARSGRDGFIYTFSGAALSSPDDRYQKFDFDDLEDETIDRRITDGWFAVLQHYFVAALLPDRSEAWRYYSKTLSDKRYIVGLYGPERTIGAGESATLSLDLYAGPKAQHVLEALAPGLELTVDYGVLWFIAKPLFWLLEHIHALVGNWGWSIVLLTLLVKAAFFYPSAIGYRSMAKMRRIHPRLTAIRERYANDRTRMQQAMMQLYKEERINPMSGCLPILIQIPVFIALYWVLLESVELRQAPFVLWLKDLSSPDPYYVLPIIMGATMFAQQKLNPAPLDPVQQKVMQVLPLVFTVMFALFPAGLVLYWTVSNVLSIAQQWVITRRIEESPAGS